MPNSHVLRSSRWVAAALLATVSAYGGCSASGDGGSQLGSIGGSGGDTGDASVDGTAGFGAITSMDAGKKETSLTDGPGVVNDGALDARGDACSDAGAAPGPNARVCAANTDNECDGSAETNSAFPNGANGNGFDDDCDGLVDEGCACPSVGATKECWLVSGSQADSNGNAVGWCAENGRGTTSCVALDSNELTRLFWDGECRGAQPPFPDDVCAPGDFDCDGTEANSSTKDCSCSNAEVECPTEPITTAPFPDPKNQLLVDGLSWIKNASTNPTNWQWTVTGGDCDNILPHPTFAIYPQGNSENLSPSGSQQSGLGPNSNQTGYVFGPGGNASSKIYPAFSLSGDYLVKGEFDIGSQHYECTVKVQVRAPGLRAEACWSPMPNDLDLHVARLQNPTACSNTGHGWFKTCNDDETGDDCYFSSSSGCRGFDNSPSTWGYERSPFASCHGWGSRRGGSDGCDNPRLDSDNITCDTSETDPADTTSFCAAENINIDAPGDGDRFAIGVHGFTIDSSEVRPHVNIYCNGERRLALGYDPTSGQNFPVMKVGGTADGGDMWEAAIVEWSDDGAGNTDCTITPVSSTTPKPDKDGSTAVCIDTDPQNGAGSTDEDWLFQSDGSYPTVADDLCWH